MTRITRSQFADYIATNDLKLLFIDMGWNNDNSRYAVIIDNTTYPLTAIAQKEGFKIVCCEVATIPDYQTRRSIDSQFSRQAHEHLIIFVDSHRNQRWLIPVRQADKPTRIVEIAHHHGQDIEALYQRARGLFFNLDEEGNITIVDVIDRVTGQLSQNSEKVTKKFYERFRKEHQSFRTHIHNITDDVHRDWYASLMLNRLMFCYFIQKKRFLDDNPNYLASKLQQSQTIRGSNQFYSFYRDFLLVLFHDGLGGKKSREQVQSELGRIPYLNGGLFDVHELEQRYPDITIDDAAFAQIFGFFDEYDWHLDSNPAASGREVNPDVIGYIFEKYINDRAQMGAYYTKEDITEYIAKNTIIPFLYDETARAGGADIWGEAWELLRASGDTYIYPAVRHGCALELPAHIALGISDVTLRGEWNKPAAAAYANPTEIWREVVARRQRYTALCATITEGGITHINDLITHNLNIRQFCQDVLARTTNTQLIRHFYAALHQLTILDPTCGSGAFLFAALNILEPLYAECLNRMEAAVAEQPQLHDDFARTLADMRSDKHPNQQYYIYKNIILNNLYGVDIMKEATEVAKLRLFLKLVACVDANKGKANLGIEPLPDIDFNIRAGNALVGYARLEDAQTTAENANIDMDLYGTKSVLHEKSKALAQIVKKYRQQQLGMESTCADKQAVKVQLTETAEALNQRLAALYGVDVRNRAAYTKWLTSHEPFHWCSEFYEIVEERGGFDVIIGNPPYVELTKNSINYQLSGFSSKYKDLYAYILERSTSLSKSNKHSGFIIPISIVSSETFTPIYNLFTHGCNSYFSCFSDDANLFAGITKRLAIMLTAQGNNTFITNYIRESANHDQRLAKSQYFLITSTTPKYGKLPPKISLMVVQSIVGKVKSIQGTPIKMLPSGNSSIYFTRSIRNFRPFFNFIPYHKRLNGELKIPTEMKKVRLVAEYSDTVTSFLNSNLVFMLLSIFTDMRNVNPGFIDSLVVTPTILNDTSLQAISTSLMSDFQKHKEERFNKTTNCFESYFYPSKSKSIIDEIDRVLAQHYGFSDEELDYIINYDIKYRMGRAGAEGDDSGEEE